PVSTTRRRYRPICFLPTQYAWLSTVTVPATLTRRMNVTRPADSFCRPVGTTKLPGSFRSRRPRRCWAGVWPPRRGGAGWLLAASCRRANSRRRSPRRGKRRLEPAVEVLDAAVELRLAFRDEHRPDAEAQAQPDHPRQGARVRPPAGQLAGVVQLDLLGDAEVLPALAEEPEDLVHAAGVG